MTHQLPPMPEGMTEEHLEYLDDLRDSGVTNMFGATPFLETEFNLTNYRASMFLGYWMDTFTDRQKGE